MILTCQRCSTEFSTRSKGRKFCTFACSCKARNRENWHQYDDRSCKHCGASFRVISWSKAVFCTHACSASDKRGKPTGRAINADRLRRKRVARVKIDGRTVFLHRHLVEQSVGRPLLSSETVHHIDCDSFNNALSNLHLFTDEQEHQLAHWSIERLVRPLLDLGVIEFVDAKYQLTAKWSALAVAVTAAAARDPNAPAPGLFASPAARDMADEPF